MPTLAFNCNITNFSHMNPDISVCVELLVGTTAFFHYHVVSGAPFYICIELSSFQTELIKSGAVLPQEADQLVNDTLIPMIGSQQKIYEANMEQIDVSL